MSSIFEIVNVHIFKFEKKINLKSAKHVFFKQNVTRIIFSLFKIIVLYF